MEPKDTTVSENCQEEPPRPASTGSSEKPAATNDTTAVSPKVPANVEPEVKVEVTAIAENMEKPAKPGPKGRKAKNLQKAQRQKSKVVRTRLPTNDSDSDSSEDEADDSSSSGSNSSDSSSSDSDSDEPKSKSKRQKKRLKSQKKTKAKTKAKKKVKDKQGQECRTRDSRSRKKQVDSNSDSDSEPDADSPDASDSSNDKGSDSRTNRRAKNQDIGTQLESLRLQFTQLQNQVGQAHSLHPSGPGGLGYGYANGMAQPVGYAWGGAAQFPPAIPSQISLPAPSRLLPPPPPPQINFRRRDSRSTPTSSGSGDIDDSASDPEYDGRRTRKKKSKSATLMDYKRVDWIWDTKRYTYKLQDTSETPSESLYNEYIFHVRRTFDCEGKYRTTIVDIKSKLLRECLKDVIGNISGVSLVDDTPKIDPNTLFLYLEDLRTHLKNLKKAKPAGNTKREKKKNQKRLDNKCKQLKVLIKYLDKDYAKTKQSLYPMLANGLITYDLLWALWKPDTLAIASTYGSTDEPRVFKVEAAERHSNILKGDFYYVDGKYLEFDGKNFGYGSWFEEISQFQGAQKITNLSCYPLKYHKNEAQVRKDLIERGKKFVSLSGVHYKSYSGLAYLKRKRNSIVKFNIQHSRVMVDPAIFRRINPNYYVSMIRPKDEDILSDGEFSDEDMGGDNLSDDSCCGGGDKVKFVTKVFKTPDGNVCMAKIPKDQLEEKDVGETLESLPNTDGADSNKSTIAEMETDGASKDETEREFTDDEYLVASPVVLGFAFSEKQWLEFAVSGINEIKWNETAWDSLVLEPATKDLVQALVKSRKYNAAQTIDDVIQGKGKGLVTVLHGPPGTGKTLTAEGISELLKCPLYMASAGELGTDSRYLEVELQKILDICHAWGAILLLDEADVFLEKRNMHEIQRNALVSIFLRQLEYFQGILFLTTNRVETFDEAFQSRIHIALRYDALDMKAKKSIFKLFIERVKAAGKMEIQAFTDEDLTTLAKHDLNGREIKNVIGSAQDLAVSKAEALSMRHVRQVLEVHAKFGRDLRGGTGYEDAMRSYF